MESVLSKNYIIDPKNKSLLTSARYTALLQFSKGQPLKIFKGKVPIESQRAFDEEVDKIKLWLQTNGSQTNSITDLNSKNIILGLHKLFDMGFLKCSVDEAISIIQPQPTPILSTETCSSDECEEGDKCETLNTMIKSVTTQINKNPSILCGDHDIKHKLRSQGNANAQGTGNQVTSQEACFAALLESVGFKHSIAKKCPPEDGYYYIYQPYGTQRNIDFEIFKWMSGKKMIYNFDLKHTTKSSFVLNDGWFHKNIIYVITWVQSKHPQSLIALGQDIPLYEETLKYQTMRIEKNKHNEDKGIGSLRSYFRFANTYKCDRFTTEYTAKCFSRVLSFIH